jgi:adenine-specific DNA-methyltransferase
MTTPFKPTHVSVIPALEPIDTQSANMVEGNLAQLKTLFPEAFKEGGVDFEVLKQLLGGQVDEREEKYGLNWHGKRRARQIALTPSTGTLRPCPGESVDWDTTQNLMIEGDNLEVLKLLQKSYAGKVKMIYIDPPYNTGKDFVYPDNFTDNIKNYLELTGQTDGEGRKLSSNTEASGRFHTDWLNMMYPRLKLAKSLLRRDGLLIISIDDKELHNLRVVANDLFGEENFVATVNVVTNMKGRNDKKHIAACHEYIVIYAGSEFISNGLPLTEEQKAAFKHIDFDGNKYALRDLRKRGGPDKREDRPNMFFPIYWDETTDKCTLEQPSASAVKILPYRGDGAEGCWRWGKEKVQLHLDWLKAKRSGKTGRLDVEHRLYLDANIALDTEEDQDEEDEGVVERTSKPKSVWIGGEFSSDSGKRALKELLPGTTFDFPKSVELIRTCVLLGTSKNDIVMDFFAGSATTGQAVLAQNEIDGQSRRYLLVQLPEYLDGNEKDQKAAAEFCDSIGKPRNISELTKERLRRAAIKIGASRAATAESNSQLSLETELQAPRQPLDLGFKVFKLDTSNIRAWNPNPDELADTLMAHTEHLATGRSEADVLYEVLLKQGLDLAVPVQRQVIAGHTVHSVGAGALLVCLAAAVNARPRDYESFAQESVKAMAQSSVTAANAEALALGIANWHTQLATALGQTPQELHTRVVLRDSLFDGDVAKTNLTAILRQRGLEDVRSL